MPARNRPGLESHLTVAASRVGAQPIQPSTLRKRRAARQTRRGQMFLQILDFTRTDSVLASDSIKEEDILCAHLPSYSAVWKSVHSTPWPLLPHSDLYR